MRTPQNVFKMSTASPQAVTATPLCLMAVTTRSVAAVINRHVMPLPTSNDTGTAVFKFVGLAIRKMEDACQMTLTF